MRTTIATLLIATLFAACNSTPEEPAVTTTTVEQPQPKPGCSLSMRQIKPGANGSVTAVTGIMHCPPNFTATQSVLLYAKGEAINAKEANVYSITDTVNLISLSWAHDTLVVTQQALDGITTLQQDMVDGTPIRYIVIANMASL